ncbi:MAG: hypothetical protein JWM64_2720 [Frankiales bacterium]|nr:hypothetical protein [Frankiales bacterium]
MSIADDVTAGVQEMPVDEGRRLLDEAARRKLGMSGPEFAEAWDQGRFADQDSAAVNEVAMLLPFGR